MGGEERARRVRDWVVLAGFVAVCLSAGVVGSLLSASEPGEWYASLRKPAYNPPGWVFGPVWTVLYVCMGVAAWLVWRRRAASGRGKALGLFGAQLVLNAAWAGLFFGLRSPGLALAEIAALLVLVAWTAWAFLGVRRAAGWLMAPYLAWVAFAAVLNLALWRLNA